MDRTMPPAHRYQSSRLGNAAVGLPLQLVLSKGCASWPTEGESKKARVQTRSLALQHTSQPSCSFAMTQGIFFS